MKIEQGPSDGGEVVTFTDREEVQDVGAGLMLFGYFYDKDDFEYDAFIGLKEFHERGFFPNETVSFDTGLGHEKMLLRCLGWVVRERQRLMTEVFAEAVELHGAEQAFADCDAVALDDRFERLTGMVELLHEAGVIDPEDSL